MGSAAARGEQADCCTEYTRRLEQRRRASERWARLASITSNARLAVFAAAAVVAWFALGVRNVAPAWLAPPVLSFAALVLVHDRLLRAGERAQRGVAHYERGLARAEDRWAGGGESGERFRDAQHPYAEDLDLFGSGSLFDLLCTARTRAGEAILAAWLLAPAEPARIRARQEAVAELAPGLELREDLALVGADVRAGLHAEALRAWGEAPPLPVAAWHRAAAALLPALSLLALAAWVTGVAVPYWFELALVGQALFAGWLRGRVQRVLRGIDLPVHDLALFAELLARIERERFRAPELVRLREALETNGVSPSRRIARLRLLADLLDARRNQLFAPIGALLLWTTQLALATERWRVLCGPHVGDWIEASGEFEALSAFAACAYEHPAWVFPEIVEGGARVEAEALGHPLLPAGRRVCNDVALGGELRVLVVSGSNMSGKSTWLRTLGINAALALAGGPVCARRLSLSPLAVGASLRIQDSLREGRSRFYAEIGRIRDIMQRSEGPTPVLFLLDEILHGTNSHDRGIGAEAIVRGLLERGAIGLVTTHDLALARVAESLAPRAANVHFEDHVENGEIAFDFRLRPGVVEKSNALELMRAVGLEV